MTFRERLDTLSRGELAGLAVVLVVTLAGAGLWYTRSLPKSVTIAEAPGLEGAAPAVAAANPGSGDPSATPLASDSPVAGAVPDAAGPVIVDVTGWVRQPGVYEFPAGSRVIDAIERAGGPREHAELAVLNLAAPLADGQQIVVPKQGEAVPVPGVSGAATDTGGVPAVPGATGPLVNVNTADAIQLETLPGVGPVLAGSIIQHRTEHGPFTTVEQLEDVSGIGPATLEKLRPLVTL